MNCVIAITLAVVAACHIGAVPFIQLPSDIAVPSVTASLTEKFQFKGFRILRRKDLGACMITRDDVSNLKVRSVNENKLDEENRILDNLANVGDEVKKICGSLKMVVFMNPSAPASIDNSISAHLNIERSFLNSNVSIDQFGQLFQSLFGVWALPGLTG